MRLLMMVFLGLLANVARAGGITVQRVHGDVTVRHGVAEAWNTVAPGDILRPDDSMKTGRNGTAILLVGADGRGTGAKKITLPPEVIVDMSDIRKLSQEEMLLKLTMEKVRASSYEWRNEELRIPDAAVVHGEEKGVASTEGVNNPEIGKYQLNGARVLYDHAFYSTCALKSMEVFRLYPPLGKVFENRRLLAEALANADCKGEAVAEYGAMTKLEGLTAEQEGLVQIRLSQLRK